MPGVWKTNVDISWLGATGSPGTNVWYFRDSTPAGTGGLDTAMEALEAFYTAIRSLYRVQVTISSEGQWNGALTANAGEFSTVPGFSVTGSSGDQYMPPGVCAVLERRAVSGGRRGRGRAFIGPLTMGATTEEGVLKTASVTILQNAANALLDVPETEAGSFCLVNRAFNQARDVESYIAKKSFGMLRSRRD